MLSCSIWFSAPSFWMDGGLESRCISRVCGADGAAPDGRMYPKHVELSIHQYNYLVASSWHFKLFHSNGTSVSCVHVG